MARLMIVDDSLFQRKNLEKMAQQMGWEVVAEAANGIEALALYSGAKPDVVLMDLMMPEMEGIEAVEKLIAMDKKAKIVIVSSIGYDDIVHKALNLGARKFIGKPVNLSHAAEVIQSVLEAQ